MEIRNTFSILFYMKKTRVNKNGESPIYLRITYSGKKTTLSIHRSIELKYWNSKLGIASGSDKKVKILNRYLQSIQSTIYEHYKYLREGAEPISVTDIRDSYLGIEKSKGKKIIELFQEHNDKIKSLENIDYSPATIQRYNTCLKITQNYIKKKYNTEDIYITELDHEFITDYEIYIKIVRKCAHNTTLKYIRNFKKIVRIAISSGYIQQDPFINFKMTMKKVDRGFLSEKELNVLINKELHTTRLEEVRDCFLFSCFTGLAHSDLKRLSRDNIVNGTDGGKWIKIKRLKTDNLSSIPILSVTQKLINKYMNNPYCNENNVLMPVRSNQKMNAYLKEIAIICEIKQNLTSHLARHTFATTVTLNNDVPLETVSKMLGHSSIAMTRTYARLLDKKVGKDMQQINEKFDLAI